jgi:hypothetical protein
MAELIVIKELKELPKSSDEPLYEAVRVCGLSIVSEIGSPIKEDSFFAGIRAAYSCGELFIDVDIAKQTLTIRNGSQRSFKIKQEDVFWVVKTLDGIKYERNCALRIFFETMNDGRESWSIYFERVKRMQQLRVVDCPIPHPDQRKFSPPRTSYQFPPRERYGRYVAGKDPLQTKICD